ncbi:MAG: DUF3137 domain-containing protein [Bacteroidota bacterium]
MPRLDYGQPVVAQLEQERRQALERIQNAKRTGQTVFIVTALLAGVLWFMYRADPPPAKGYWIIALAAGLFGGLIMLAIGNARATNFRKRYTVKVLPIIAKEVLPDIVLKEEDTMPEHFLIDAGLVRGQIDDYESKRYFEGLIAGLPASVSEVRASRTETKINPQGKVEFREELLFQGILLVAERYGHPGISRIQFREPSWDITNLVSGYFSGMTSRPEIQLGTDDPTIGKLFTIDSDEPEAARNLVTEELLVILKKLKDSGKGVPEAIITPTHLYVALHGEDFILHPDYRKPVHQQATTSHQVEEFELLLKSVILLAVEPGE